MIQYVCEYESTDENDDHDEMIQYFEEFSISIIFASAITSAVTLTISSTNITNALLIEFESNELFLISFDELQNIEFEITISLLSNQAFKHRFISKDCIIITALINEFFSFISIIDSRYDDHEFKNILIDCETANLSINDIEQFKILKRISNNNVRLNTKTIESNIKFEIDNISILSTVALNTSLELIIFHIVEVNTLFLLSLINLNWLKMYFNNLINKMIQKILEDQNTTNFQISSKIRRHSIIRRHDHAFLLWKVFTYSLIVEFIDENSCLLIEIELCRLYRRFDHFSTRRLYEILTRSDHDNVESRVIEHLNKYCHHYQLHEKFSERFSFSIRNSDSEFNFNILMNILYIEIKLESENKFVLHLMNEATRFQVDRWLKNISARHVWNKFRTCWIDTYLKSSDVIIIDFDKQFVFREFKEYANNMKIIVKIVSIEAHHSIEMMKRYHESLRRTYSIITVEISKIDSELALQMIFKVINDSIELNDLISTLLVFEIYLWMIEMNVASFIITQRSIAMKKTMNEMRKLHAIRQINDPLNTRNDSIFLTHDLSLNSLVLIFRKSNIDQLKSWKESFKLLSIQSESTIVELSSESTKFRSTSIKSYYQNHDHTVDENSLFSSTSNMSSFIEFEDDYFAIDLIIRILIYLEYLAFESSKRDRDRSRKYSIWIANHNFTLNSITDSTVSRFIASRQQKIAELLEKDVFLSINKIDVSLDVRIFSSRFVNKIKHLDIDKIFKKFRLVVQAFKNQNKTFVLTQSSIIQKVNQRLIICLAVTLSQMKLYLRNITQIYVQSRSIFNKNFYVQSLLELIKLIRIFNHCILKMIKSLYDVSKANNHWFKTYHDHHIDKLKMIQFIYDSCLLYIIVISYIDISIVSMQTNDTRILVDQSFAAVENEAINSSK
jgi:hypothetical protein